MRRWEWEKMGKWELNILSMLIFPPSHSRIFPCSHLPNTSLLFVVHLINMSVALDDIQHFDGGFDGSSCLIRIQSARFEIPP